ncbi:hypothetical protein DK419_04860 [Methylobacterium terrae]|uniref:DUF6916 domain-containing protein n=1 Tax=Methylobacterium terrae TaxID=2202827 RepID=A0A2U8WI50_9HYPH|nr:hypothetical protein [Methylobacterium terrae]AWN45729.1 hypothetical protein DK419_04860 [Methylobacterium terrae]
MTAALATLSAGLFAPALGEAFALRGPDGRTLAVTLARCVEHPRSTMPGSARTAFDLVLTCPADAAEGFPDGDCVLSHDALGEFGPLYAGRILPVGFPPGSAAYQVIFI